MGLSLMSQSEGYANRVAVLPIVSEGPHGSASLSTIFKSVSSEVSKRLGIRAITYEEMFVASKDGLGKSVLECGPQAQCISSKLRAFSAKMGLVVVLNFELSPPVLSVQLVDTDLGELKAESLGEVSAQGEAALIEAIKKRTRGVLDQGGYVTGGRMVVKVEPPSAQIRLPGKEPDKGTPNVFTLPPGNYELSASQEGYSSATAKATVTSGQTTQVSLNLSKQSRWYASPWLWAGVGAVVVGATTAAIVATRSPSRCLCVMFGPRGCEQCTE